MGVKYWIGGTTGETGSHSILFARFYPRGDPGRIPTGSRVQISSPASREILTGVPWESGRKLAKIATYTSEGNDIKELAFLTRELRACARASYRYDVENGTRSLARLVDSCKLFFDFRLLSTLDSFWRVINKRNGDLCC